MSEQASPGYRWTTLSEPDALVVQLVPVPVVTGSGTRDVVRSLLLRRGFRRVVETTELDLGAATGCVLTRSVDDGPALLIAVGGGSDATRIALPGIDEQWWSRAVTLAHAAVLAVTAAVDDEGRTTRDALRRDVAADGVVAALVPVEDMRGAT